MLLGTGCSLGCDRAQRGGATLGHDHGIDTGSIGRAQQGAKVLGIFHAVKGKHQSRGAGGFQDVLNGQELLRADDGDDPLMGWSSGNVIEGLARLGAYPDLERTTKGDNRLESLVAPLARHQDVIKAATTGPERLFHRVNSIENLHLFSVTVLLSDVAESGEQPGAGQLSDLPEP